MDSMNSRDLNFVLVDRAIATNPIVVTASRYADEDGVRAFVTAYVHGARGEPVHLSPDEARRYAASLLAAADEAERPWL